MYNRIEEFFFSFYWIAELQAMSTDNDDLYDQYSLATEFYSRGEIVETLRTLKPILLSADSELKKKALVLLAEICQKRKETDRAIKFFQTALGLATDPFEQATYLNKIGIFTRLNHDSECYCALQYFDSITDFFLIL